MAKTKPKYEEYKKWLKDERDFEITDRTRLYYEEVANIIKGIFQESLLWKTFNRNRNYYRDEFFIKSRGYSLWSNGSEPVELKTKPYDSFLLKTYRRNILDNRNL